MEQNPSRWFQWLPLHHFPDTSQFPFMKEELPLQFGQSALGDQVNPQSVATAHNISAMILHLIHVRLIIGQLSGYCQVTPTKMKIGPRPSRLERRHPNTKPMSMRNLTGRMITIHSITQACIHRLRQETVGRRLLYFRPPQAPLRTLVWQFDDQEMTVSHKRLVSRIFENTTSVSLSLGGNNAGIYSQGASLVAPWSEVPDRGDLPSRGPRRELCWLVLFLGISRRLIALAVCMSSSAALVRQHGRNYVCRGSFPLWHH